MSKNMNNNDSLKKSHSKASNAKLTLLCVLTILAFSALWIGLALIPSQQTLGWIITIAGGVITLLGLVGFNVFKR